MQIENCSKADAFPLPTSPHVSIIPAKYSPLRTALIHQTLKNILAYVFDSQLTMNYSGPDSLSCPDLLLVQRWETLKIIKLWFGRVKALSIH